MKKKSRREKKTTFKAAVQGNGGTNHSKEVEIRAQRVVNNSNIT